MKPILSDDLTQAATAPPTDALPGALPLTDLDHALIAAANDTLARHYRTFWHTVAAAIRSKDGRIWTGIHIGTTVGRLAVCAEAVAFGRAVLEGDGTIETAVAVRHPKPEEVDRELAVVSPCGACREMIMDHAPVAGIILMAPTGLVKLPIRTLLPVPYRR
ncbi:MAG: cytidine deaminase [Rhodospirillales bacterium]|nr:cytidine deaminase [Rhodospirillales bacterium]